jgi:LacI family transcriptional regulator
MAAGCISAVFEAGLQVPNNMSVAGFDDIPLASQVWPPLTTVQQPIYKIAEIATNILIRLLKGETFTDLKQEVETALVIRKSTAAKA